MKWIEFAEFENYKIFKKRRFEFDRRMNVLTGPSDKGKSTLLKGIRKCLDNEPNVKAESLLTWNAPRGSQVKIRVGIRDDQNGKLSPEDAILTIIERVMGRGNINEYNIIWANGETTTYSRFGKSVPPEVRQVHGMREVDMGYGKESLNYIGQFDGFFLLGRRPEEIATAIGRLAQTDIIDKVKADLRSDIASNTRSLNVVNKSIVQEAEIVKSFSYLNDVEDYLEALDELRASIHQDKELCVWAENLSESAENVADSLEEVEDRLSRKIDFRKAIGLLEEAEPLMEQAVSLRQMMDRSVLASAEDLARVEAELSDEIDFDAFYDVVDSLTADIDLTSDLSDYDSQIKKTAKRFSELGMEEDIDFKAAYAAIDEATELLTLSETMSKIKRKANRVADQLMNQYKVVEEAKEEADKAMAVIKDAMKGKCPVCGGSIEGRDIDEITMHLE